MVCYFFNIFFENFRYEEVPPMLLHDDDGKACFTCSHLENKRRSQIPILEEDFETNSNTLLFKDQVFRIGSGVMVLPNTFDISIRQKKEFRKMRELGNYKICYFVTEIVVVIEKNLKFDAEGRKLAKNFRSLEQFVQTIFGNRMLFNLFLEVSHT